MKTIDTNRLLAAIAKQPEPDQRASLPRITNTTAKRAAIYLYDAVSQWTAANAKEFQRQLSAITAPAIDLHINSPGGSVFEGLTMYALLKAHPAKITTHIDGLAASIASIIALAGDEVEIAEGGMMMIHDASLATQGNSRQLRKDAELLEQISESLTDIYVSRTGRSRAAIREEMIAETWYSANAAVTAKLATRKVQAQRAAAQWKTADFPTLPAAAKALASAGPPPLPQPGSLRQVNAELDRLRSENLSLKSQLETKSAAPAAVAKTTAMPTKTATSPAPLGKQESRPSCPANLSGLARIEWFKAQTLFTPETAKFSTDHVLKRTATSPLASEPERTAAMAEMTRRGWTHLGNDQWKRTA